MAKGAVNVRIVASGVTDVLKSDGVKSVLYSQAQDYAARCTALMQSRFQGYGSHFGAKAVERRWVAGGLVHTTDMFTIIDNHEQNTLKKGCNV